MNTKSFLIKDTTKEERIALIKEWICMMLILREKRKFHRSIWNLEQAITQKESLKKRHLDVDRDIQDDK